MFENEILRLSRQGFTTGGIAKQLGLSPQYVRSVVSADVAGIQVKPVYGETTAPPPKQDMASRHKAARRVAAEAKRAEALKLLAEAQSDLAR